MTQDSSHAFMRLNERISVQNLACFVCGRNLRIQESGFVLRCIAPREIANVTRRRGAKETWEFSHL